ncbi:uncharacterized protein LOC107368706 isoform X2 [Tetranychus urticae]|uniref:Fibronectin type-III domain-containing protein n=1 Tax=Tetranychus urticae TaxID=32264 RepID=T1KZK8_TETUR|nr:uncharacterized protein LOC107368706 isoform X2 [Tetranychus urticae]
MTSKFICVLLFGLFINYVYADEVETLTVDVTEVGDTFVSMNIIAPSHLNYTYFEGINVQYLLQGGEKQEELIAVNDRRKVKNIRVNHLEPNSHYILNVSAKYGDVYLANSKGDIEVTMKAAAPKSALVKEIKLQLNGQNVATYHIQVDRIIGINKLVNCVSATVEVSYSDVFTLNLVYGERYSVKTWYVDTDGRESATVTSYYV